METVELIATAAFGLEASVKREVESLENVQNMRTLDGRIYFSGGLELIAQSNINLRCADRVLIVMGELNAASFDELYDNVFLLDWQRWIPKNGKFPVSGKSVKSILSSVPACQKIVKKAIADKLLKSHGVTYLNETGAEYPISVSILKDKALLTIDTTGVGLHKRGYRIKNYSAPLKETLAAALLDLSHYTGETEFFDPFCGSGTIAVEAALKAAQIAPGLNRSFLSKEWKNLDSHIWIDATDKAQERINLTHVPPIFAADISGSAIKLAKENARNAGVDKLITFETADFCTRSLPIKKGTVVCNPPYGERIGEEEEVRSLYRRMGEVFRSEKGIGVNVLTSFSGFSKLYAKKPDRLRKIYNANLQSFFYSYIPR